MNRRERTDTDPLYSAPPRTGEWVAAVGLWLIGLSSLAAVPVLPEADPKSSASGSNDAGEPEHRSKTWPGFRGVGGKGLAVDADPPITWSAKEGKNILWQTSIAKHGMSSPIVSEHRVFLTAADDSIRQVLAYDANTGRLLWHHDVDGIPGSPGDRLPDVLEETGYASPTPVTDGRHVVAVFGTGELVCVTVDGERVWAKHLGIPKNHYGHASSLASYENLVIVQYDEENDPRLLAFDLASGRPTWRVKRASISWASPILVDNQGRRELILANCKAVDSYDPGTGRHLWQVNCLDGEVAPSPAYADGVVFVGSEGATATAIDISKHEAEPKILWQWDEALPDAASPLAHGDCLILPTGFGVVSCLDARTGRVLWEHEFDEGFYSSPILVNDRVYLADLSGAIHIFKMAPEFELLATSEVGEAVYATPAFVGERIYLRGLTQLFCIEAKD